MGGIYWLASYPKSGNTWFRTFLRNLLEDGDQPADINDLSTGNIASSRGWLDEVLGFDTAELDPDEVDRLRPEVYRWSLRDDEIGYHKIHDAYTFTRAGEPLVSREATLGALYILRNPLDVVPSYANHNHSSIDDAIQRMGESEHALCKTRKSLPNQTRQKLLTWSEHVLSWVDAPGLNCHVIRYEDMLADPIPTFTEAARFLQLPDDPARIEKAIRFSDFKVLAGQEAEKGFRERPPKAERFFRQGKTGDWRDKLTPAQVERIIAHHGSVMRRFGYLDSRNQPVISGGTTGPKVEHDIAQPGPASTREDNLFIESPRFLLKPMKTTDVTDEYVSWWNDEAIQAGLNARPRGWDRFKAENHVRGHDNRKRYHLGLWRKGGPQIGFVSLGLHQQGQLAELTMVIGTKTYWGKRVPDEILPRLFDYFFTRLPTQKIKALIVANNKSSLAVMPRVGFGLEGVLREEWSTTAGGRTDVHVYSVLKRDWLNHVDPQPSVSQA